MITENFSANPWAQIITEEYHVEDKGKLAWVSVYAQNHQNHENRVNESAFVNGSVALGPNNMGPAYATPLNTIGMGNPYAPANLDPNSIGGHAEFQAQGRGSGDTPMSTLPMALNVALYTIGLELVPVVPSKGPWQMLSYMDFPYAGGKLGRINETSFDGIGAGDENKPKYVKLDMSDDALDTIRQSHSNAGDNVEMTVTTSNGVLTGIYKGFSRMDGKLILEVKSCQTAAGEDTSIASVLRGATDVVVNSEHFLALDSDYEGLSVEGSVRPDFVQTAADLMDGFANFATGKKEPMTRAQNENGTGNTIGLRLFSKWVQMGSYEVTGTVTRQQLQDLPLYGVDAVAKVMESMQNELTQHINQRILERVFSLGTVNHDNQKRFQGADLDIDFDVLASEANTYENLATRQRRVASRILAAANLIQVTGRRGSATWAVMSAKMASALQDNAAYVVQPIANTLVQDQTSNLYNAGTLAGLQIYVDPYMSWDDNRICVGRKGDANSPGVIFMPYILADTVSITAEGTMAPHMLVNSRFAIVEAGFYPELMYYTFNVKEGAYSII